MRRPYAGLACVSLLHHFVDKWGAIWSLEILWGRGPGQIPLAPALDVTGAPIQDVAGDLGRG